MESIHWDLKKKLLSTYKKNYWALDTGMVGARLKFHWIPATLTSLFYSSKADTMPRLEYHNPQPQKLIYWLKHLLSMQ